MKAVCTRLVAPNVRYVHSLTQTTNAIPSNIILTGVCKSQILKEEKEVKVSSPEECDNVIRTCNNPILKHQSSVMSWVDNMQEADPKYNQVACLHPSIFDVHPKMDVLYKVVEWQKAYREVDYAWTRNRGEIGKGKKKPWPQKGTGRKRQGSTNTQMWKGGGIVHGPRGPQPLFYTLGDEVLVKGLTSALTIKFLQNDLIIANPMNCLPDDGFYTLMIKNRKLNESSILFVHGDHEYPESLGDALEYARTQSMMPLSALNVYSILKHDKLVLSMNILDELEDKLIWQMKRYDWHVKPHNFYKDMPGRKYIDDESNFIGS